MNETLVAYNFTTGLYSNNAHWLVFKQCFLRYHKCSNPECPLFAMFYEGICRDKHGALPPDFASAGHMEVIWKSLPKAQCFLSKGTRVRLSRWWSWHDRQGEVQQLWHTIALGLVVVGIEKDWWPNVFESPYLKMRSSPPVDPGVDKVELSAADIEGEELPRSVKAVSEMIDNKRQDCANTLHFACNIFANDYIRRLSRAMWHIELPRRTYGGETMKQVKTLEGYLEFSLANVSRDNNVVLVEMAGKIHKGTVLVDLCFAQQCDSQHELADEALLANKMFWVSMSLLGSYLTWLPFRSDSLPWMCAGLLSPSAGKRQACLKRLKKLWETLLLYEQRIGNADVSAILDGLMWDKIV